MTQIYSNDEYTRFTKVKETCDECRQGMSRFLTPRSTMQAFLTSLHPVRLNSFLHAADAPTHLAKPRHVFSCCIPIAHRDNPRTHTRTQAQTQHPLRCCAKSPCASSQPSLLPSPRRRRLSTTTAMQRLRMAEGRHSTRGAPAARRWDTSERGRNPARTWRGGLPASLARPWRGELVSHRSMSLCLEMFDVCKLLTTRHAGVGCVGRP